MLGPITAVSIPQHYSRQKDKSDESVNHGTLKNSDSFFVDSEGNSKG